MVGMTSLNIQNLQLRKLTVSALFSRRIFCLPGVSSFIWIRSKEPSFNLIYVNHRQFVGFARPSDICLMHSSNPFFPKQRMDCPSSFIWIEVVGCNIRPMPMFLNITHQIAHRAGNRLQYSLGGIVQRAVSMDGRCLRLPSLHSFSVRRVVVSLYCVDVDAVVFALAHEFCTYGRREDLLLTQ